MAEQATILIPDISGYTEFLTRTALVHSSHIINELLDLIVASNTLGLTLSEIEGDAVLFYRKGPPIALDDVISQCLTTFENFHRQLKIIGRDTVCPCDACQTATDLSLKCIVHYGTIKEITVARFTKATGVDMIIAHRLLKNGIGASEYILTTQDYLQRLGDPALPPVFPWQRASDEYPGVGSIAYHYALLDRVKGAIPEPPTRESPVIELGGSTLEIVIDAPLLTVYQKTIDLDSLPQWVPGVESMERDEVTERIGIRHVCSFEGMVVEKVAVSTDIRDDHITYCEEGRIRGTNIAYRDIYRLKALPEAATALTVTVTWLSDLKPPEEFVRQFMDFFRVMLEHFKQFCESQPS